MYLSLLQAVSCNSVEYFVSPYRLNYHKNYDHLNKKLYLGIMALKTKKKYEIRKFSVEAFSDFCIPFMKCYQYFILLFSSAINRICDKS